MRTDGAIITNAGQELLSYALANNKQVNFTKVKLGKGDVNTFDEAKKLTDVVSFYKQIPITSIAGNNAGIVRIRSSFTNADFPLQVVLKEIGVFAVVEGKSEVLFGYVNDGEGESFPPGSSGNIVERVRDIYVGVSTNTQVTAVVDRSVVYATIYDLDEEIAKCAKKITRVNPGNGIHGGGTLGEDITVSIKSNDTSINLDAANGITLKKTTSWLNDAAQLFTAKGALNLFNTLTTNFTDAINIAKEALRLDIIRKQDKTDNTLTTVAKNIVDSINEVNKKVHYIDVRESDNLNDLKGVNDNSITVYRIGTSFGNTEKNYPVGASAGTLTVIRTFSTHIIQQYQNIAADNKQFLRVYKGTWGEWNLIYSDKYKTDLPENDTNKVFSAKGAFDLKTWLITNYTTLMNNIRDNLTNTINTKTPHGGYSQTTQQLKNEVDTKLSKNGDTINGTIVSTSSIALKIVSDTYKDITYHQRYGRVVRTAMSTEQVNGESKGTYFVGLQEADSSDFLKKFTIKSDGVYEDNVRMYSPLNKPSKTDVGLENVQNYPITDSTDDPSSNMYCSALAVKDVKDIAKKYLWDEITGSGVDLNTIIPNIDKTMCVYRIGSSTIATGGINFPSTSAGVLECIRSYSTHVVQNYYDVQGKVFTRFRSGTETWTNWIEITAVTSKLDKGIYTGNAQDLKNLIDTKFNSSGGNITGIPNLNFSSPYIYFADTRSGTSDRRSYIGFGGAINRFQIVNGHSQKAIVLEDNGNLTYDDSNIRTDSINKRVSIFTKNGGGTTTGNYADGYNIDIYKDSVKNDCNITFSSADNSLTITESGTYEIIVKGYLNISGGTAGSSSYGSTTKAQTRLTLNGSTDLLYNEYTVTRNSNGYSKIVSLNTGDKIRFNSKRIAIDNSSLEFYNGEEYNSITFRRIGG